MDDKGGASMANKRPRLSPPTKQPPVHSSSTFCASTTMDQRPDCLHPELTNVDSLLHNLLDLPISDSSSSSVAVDVSFEKLLSSKFSDSKQNLLINRALLFGSALVDSAKRHARRIASKHNSHVWALPHDLTIKVCTRKLGAENLNRIFEGEQGRWFYGPRSLRIYNVDTGGLLPLVFSLLDTSSLCCAAATCTMFCRCAMDPMCYVDIDLRTYVPRVNNAVVSTMIQRAGKGLQSMKVGIVDGPNRAFSELQPLPYTVENSIDTSGCKWFEKRSMQGKDPAILTRSCLNCLTVDSAASGSVLRKLHLYHIHKLDNTSLCRVLSACPSLLDFKVVGLFIELRQILESVSLNCHLLERLFVLPFKAGRYNSLKLQTCVEFVKNCPHLTSLALRGLKLHDNKARLLIQGLHKLKHVDFSLCSFLNGSFLRDLGSLVFDCPMEVLLVRDCVHLKEAEVQQFVMSLEREEFKFLHQIDISNKEGLASEGNWTERCSGSSWTFYRDWLSKKRPNLRLLAEFPPEESFFKSNYRIGIDVSDMSGSSQLSSHYSDSSYSSSSSEPGLGLSSESEDTQDSDSSVSETD